MRPALPCLALLAVVAAPSLATAQAPVGSREPPKLTVRLVLTRGAGAEVCAPTEALREALSRGIQTRRGYDPFVPNSTGTPAGVLSVKVGRPPGDRRLGATYTYIDEAGAPVWEAPKRYIYAGTDKGSAACFRVIEFVAAVFALELIPPPAPPVLVLSPARPPAPVLSSARPLPSDGAGCAASPGNLTPPPCRDSRFSDVRYDNSQYAIWPTEWPLSPLPKPQPDPPKPPERWPVALRGSIAVWPEFIATGWGSFGLTAEFGARYHAVSAGVEFHGDPSLGSDLYPRSVRSASRASPELSSPAGTTAGSQGVLWAMLDASSFPITFRRSPRRPSTAPWADVRAWSFRSRPRACSSPSPWTCARRSTRRATIPGA